LSLQDFFHTYRTLETKAMIEKEVKRLVKGLEEELGETCDLITTYSIR
jgi:hypothetical protein